MEPKAIIEDFEPEYGRMNAMLGVEIPLTGSNVQTTIPYFDIDPPTEDFKAMIKSVPIGTLEDGTQLWKITHNGVDTHAIHWHLFNVQLINRVGWDGAIRPPDANEIGWKDTIRMNPLEDIIVAMKPIIPNLPWDLPNSIRPLDVTAPLNTATPQQFHGVDPAGEPAPVVNHLVNFGWEYVWHCHLLGHEENIMMRPIILAVAPREPIGLTAAPINGNNVALSWTDNSTNEIEFLVQRSNGGVLSWTTVARVQSLTGPARGTVVTYTDKLPKKGIFNYRIIASNTVGDITVYPPPAVGYPDMTANSTPSNNVTVSPLQMIVKGGK